MAFTDNPFVSSLMQETGLNNLMAMGGAPPRPGGGSPSGSPIGAVQSGAPHSPQPVAEYKVARPPVNPRFAGPTGGNPMGGYAPPSAQQGVMSADTLNAPTVHDLLGHYGVSAPQNIDDHLFIHDPQAFAKHPMIANMLENGLTSLANYHTGQDTAGTLSNIASSVLNGQAEHQQAYNARAMAPLMQAEAVGRLQDNLSGQQYKEAQGRKDAAMGNYYEGLNASREAVGAGHDAVKQAAIDTSPAGQMSRLYHATLQNMMPDGDESKASPAQQADAMNRVMTQASIAKSAGQSGIQDKKDKTAITTAGIRASAKGAGAKIDPLDKANYSELVKQHQDLTQKVNDIDNKKPMLNELGMNMSDEERQAAKTQMVQKAAQITNQRSAIEAKYGRRGGLQQPADPNKIHFSYDPKTDSMLPH